jgi:opacity protein-like surface antigen
MISIHLKAATLIAAGTVLASPVLADGHSNGQTIGFYGFVTGGASLSSDLDYDGLIGGNPNSVDNDFDSGSQFSFGFGKSIDAWSSSKIGVRAELEIATSENDADSISFSGNGAAAEVNVSGGVRTSAIFANVLADFKNDSAFTPFVGAGLGIGHVSQNLFYGPGVTINESDDVLAAQLIAGVSYAATEKVTLTADVRHREFFNVSSSRLAPTGASTGSVRGNLGNTSLNLGVRFAF